jgi:predicted metal-dependent peptidase
MPDIGVPYQHRGTRAIQLMVEYAPSTGGLALWVDHQDLPPSIDAAAVRTDGHTVFYGRAFEDLQVRQQAGLVAHEVLHIALRHAARFLDLQQLRGDIDLQLFNICADAIVNTALAHLGWLELPAQSVYLDDLLARVLDVHRGPEAALLHWDVEQLYTAIDDRGPPPDNGRNRSAQSARTSSSGKNGEAKSPGSGDAASSGGQSRPQPRPDGQRAAKLRALGAGTIADLVPREAHPDTPEAQAEQCRTWSERLLRGHVNDGAFSMLRTLLADLPHSRTPWEHILRSQLARALAPKPSLSWSRPTRSYMANQGICGASHRMPWEPGVSSNKNVPCLAVIVDVSGSIQAELMQRFAHEIEAISRRQESAVILIIGDDRVRHVETFSPGRADLRRIEFEGGGDTDFGPLLEHAASYRPDIAVVLTDLDGPAAFRPRFPVIWAVPHANRHAVVPFGRKVTLEG